MAQLTFPIVAGELQVDVRVNLSAPDWAVRRAANQPAPTSFETRAILDTGSNISGVSSAIIQHFSLTKSGHSTTSVIGGATPVDLYHVSLSICDAAQLHLPWFTDADLEVMELTPNTPVNVLIGMDVLLRCRMLLDGPGRQFTLDF
jgi:hypothetical protein